MLLLLSTRWTWRAKPSAAAAHLRRLLLQPSAAENASAETHSSSAFLIYSPQFLMGPERRNTGILPIRLSFLLRDFTSSRVPLSPVPSKRHPSSSSSSRRKRGEFFFFFFWRNYSLLVILPNPFFKNKQNPKLQCLSQGRKKNSFVLDKDERY